MDPGADQQHADEDKEAAKDLGEGPVIGHLMGQGQVPGQVGVVNDMR